MARTDPMYAIRYLQTRLSDVVDHNDPVQLKQFHKLATLLFHSEPSQPASQNQSFSSLSSTPMCSSPDLESMGVSIYLVFTLHGRILSSLTGSSSSSLSHNYNQCSSKFCCHGRTSPPCSDSDEIRSMNVEGLCDHKVQRCILFNRIVKLLPDHMVQPKGNLSDFVRI